MIKKLFSIFIISIFAISPIFIYAQAPGEPLIENEVEQSFGAGTFPDVAFLGNQLWLAVQQGGTLNIYRSGANNQTLALHRSFNVGGQSFPRLAASGNVMWLAFRDQNTGQQVRLWRSDTEAIENLGVGHGNSPIAMNSSTIAWQSNAQYQISIRSLSSGTARIYGRGAPTGLSRITAGGTVITIDRDRNLFPWGTKPSFAGALVAVEGPQGGAILTFNNDSAHQDTVLPGVANDPRAARGLNNMYAVTAWTPSGAVRVVTFRSILTYTPTGEIEPPDGGSAFGEGGIIPIPLTEMNFEQLLQLIINYSFYILGIALFGVVFWAGFEWFTAAGNSAKIAKAKGRIYNAIIGAILLVASFLILNTINPDLTGGTLTLDPIGDPETSTTPVISLPPGTVPAGINQPTVPLANLRSVVEAYANQNPVQLLQSCEDRYPDSIAWQFMDGAVAALQAADPRVGYNGRRGNTSDPSEDAVSYYFGPMPPVEGSRDVYVVDIITNHCPQPGTPAPAAAWTDVTQSTWQGGTTGAYIRSR